MVRNILAAIAGYAAIGVLVVITDRVFSWLIPGFRTMAMPPAFYFAVSLLTDFVYSTAGGYVCSAIAGSGSKTATVILITLGEAIGILVAVVRWQTMPHFFVLGLLVLYPLGISLGSALQRKKSSVTSRLEQPPL
ncbi:MAG: hypothetical protein ACJ746_09365 [Bryobacteraceae bacterium]